MAKTPPVNDYDVDPYTVDEVQQLFFAAQREPNGARWVFALALGLRQGEALGLQWDDVDWSRSVLTIKRSRTRPRYEHRCLPHCGHKYAGYCPNRVLSRPDFDTTKSRAGRRVVPLPAAVLELLRDHAEVQAVQRRTAAQLWVDEGWIFRRAWPCAEPAHRLGPLEEAAQGCGGAGWPTPRRAPYRCDGAPTPGGARAHDHERAGVVNDGDGQPLRTRRCSDSQRRGESARLAALVEPRQRNERPKFSR